jgi:hypothetical protein
MRLVVLRVLDLLPGGRRILRGIVRVAVDPGAQAEVCARIGA